VNKVKSAAVCDANTQTVRCEVCGDEIPIPIGPISWFVAVTQAFADIHLISPHKSVGAGFSTPVAPEDDQELDRERDAEWEADDLKKIIEEQGEE